MAVECRSHNFSSALGGRKRSILYCMHLHSFRGFDFCFELDGCYAVRSPDVDRAPNAGIADRRSELYPAVISKVNFRQIAAQGQPQAAGGGRTGWRIVLYEMKLPALGWHNGYWDPKRGDSCRPCNPAQRTMLMQRGIESTVMVAGLQGRFVALNGRKTKNDVPRSIRTWVLLCESSNKATAEVNKLGSGTCIPIRAPLYDDAAYPPQSRATRSREIH
jgi:hypothetical protein